jgi:F5/8 type C domain
MMNASASNAYSFAEIQFRTIAGVPRAFSGGIASAYNSFSGLTPAMATDGNNATFWGSSDTTPGDWKYDYGVGNAIDVVEIMMTSRPDGSYTQTPTNFTPQWSDDGLTWTPMMKVVASWTSLTQTQVFAVNFDPYSNAGGSGDRTGVINVTTTATLGNGTINNLVDGSQAADANGSVWWNQSQTGREIRFDFSLFGASRRITEATWYQDIIAVHGNWKWQGSNDGSVWTDIGAEFTLGTSTTQVISTLSGNTNFWRFYRMLQTVGSTSQASWQKEIEFIIDNTVGYPHAAMLTQIALEQWNVNNPVGQMTQIALEQWASVGGAGSFSARHI